MTKTILFVDHAAHATTTSSSFFVELLQRSFNVEIVHIHPDQAVEPDRVLPRTGVDLVIVWQLDFLTPIFLTAGLPTILVPMYDGSANMPDLHWEAMRQARILCFSAELYWRLSELKLDALCVKYFPPPVPRTELPAFDDLRAFLWQRRPEDGINVQMVRALFSNQLSSLHVHDASDDPAISGEAYIAPFRAGTHITTTHWSANNSEYLSFLSRANVYIAPRLTEGIGLGFLEAMAHGLLVAANDAPTHREYIANWVNGVLVNAAAPSPASFDLEVVRAMAYAGWMTAVDGRKRWENAIPTIIEFIEGAAASEPSSASAIEMLARELPKAYASGEQFYCAYLRRNARALRIPAARVTEPLPRAVNGFRHADVPPRSELAARLDNVPFVEATAINFGDGGARPYLVEGWSVDEAHHVWVEGTSAVFGFRLRHTDFQLGTVTICCRTLEEIDATNTCTFILNDNLLGIVDLAGTWTAQTFLIPDDILTGLNKLCIYARRCFSPPGEYRSLSIAVSSLEFGRLA